MSKRPRRKFETGFKKQLVAQMRPVKSPPPKLPGFTVSAPLSSPTGENSFKPESSLEGPTRREKALLKEMEQYKKLLAEAHSGMSPIYGQLLGIKQCALCFAMPPAAP